MEIFFSSPFSFPFGLLKSTARHVEREQREPGRETGTGDPWSSPSIIKIGFSILMKYWLFRIWSLANVLDVLDPLSHQRGRGGREGGGGVNEHLVLFICFEALLISRSN